MLPYKLIKKNKKNIYFILMEITPNENFYFVGLLFKTNELNDIKKRELFIRCMKNFTVIRNFNNSPINNEIMVVLSILRSGNQIEDGRIKFSMYTTEHKRADIKTDTNPIKFGMKTTHNVNTYYITDIEELFNSAKEKLNESYEIKIEDDLVLYKMNNVDPVKEGFDNPKTKTKTLNLMSFMINLVSPERDIKRIYSLNSEFPGLITELTNKAITISELQTIVDTINTMKNKLSNVVDEMKQKNIESGESIYIEEFLKEQFKKINEILKKD